MDNVKSLSKVFKNKIDLKNYLIAKLRLHGWRIFLKCILIFYRWLFTLIRLCVLLLLFNLEKIKCPWLTRRFKVLIQVNLIREKHWRPKRRTCEREHGGGSENPRQWYIWPAGMCNYLSWSSHVFLFS